jgi:hypothetical protein
LLAIESANIKYHATTFYGQMNLVNPATLRVQKGGQLPKG